MRRRSRARSVGCRHVSQDGSDSRAAAVAASAESTWLSRVELGMEQLLHVSHIAAPDELPGMVAAAAAMFEGEDAVVCLVDMQQRVLVPFQGPGGHHPDEFSQVLGVDSTVAGRAFQEMHQLSLQTPQG
jgi:hypothetical protein